MCTHTTTSFATPPDDITMDSSHRASDNEYSYAAGVKDSNLPDGIVGILTECVTYALNLESPRKKNSNFVRLELDWKLFQQDFRVVYKDERDMSEEDERRLLSENNTWYENITDKTTTYTFTYSFEESSLVTITTRRGFSITLIDTMKWFKKLGPGIHMAYDKLSTKATMDEKKTRQKQKIEITVSPVSAVCVKHLVYEVKQTQRCVVEVTMKKDDILKYTYSEGYIVNGKGTSKQQTHKMKVEKIMKIKGKFDDKGTNTSTKQAFEAMTVEGDKLKVRFQVNCKYIAEEHCLQSEETKINEQRIRKLRQQHC